MSGPTAGTWPKSCDGVSHQHFPAFLEEKGREGQTHLNPLLSSEGMRYPVWNLFSPHLEDLIEGEVSSKDEVEDVVAPQDQETEELD